MSSQNERCVSLLDVLHQTRMSARLAEQGYTRLLHPFHNTECMGSVFTGSCDNSQCFNVLEHVKYLCIGSLNKMANFRA